jgi:hypothetical protein
MARTTFTDIFSSKWKLALTERKKLLAYITTVVLAALDYGIIPNHERSWVALGILILGGPVIHQVQNAPKS